jgi:hypothetical protein
MESLFPINTLRCVSELDFCIYLKKGPEQGVDVWACL